MSWYWELELGAGGWKPGGRQPFTFWACSPEKRMDDLAQPHTNPLHELARPWDEAVGVPVQDRLETTMPMHHRNREPHKDRSPVGLPSCPGTRCAAAAVAALATASGVFIISLPHTHAQQRIATLSRRQTHRHTHTHTHARIRYTYFISPAGARRK